MSKSYVLFSLALGGLVLAGCGEEPKPQPQTVPSASQPSSDVKAELDKTKTTVKEAGDAAVEKTKERVSAGEEKVKEGVNEVKGALPATAPSDNK